jgi:hypothetical protein
MELKMKLDIKSVLIGVLLTINIMMLMGFQWNNSSKEEGKYKFIVSNDILYIGDSDTGKVTSEPSKSHAKWFYKP